MINIQQLIEEASANGYQGDKASAKVCQDIILKALSIGSLSRNVTISRLGKIVELRQQDYSGKQVFVMIEDAFGNQVRSKIDLGVHNRFDLEQVEYWNLWVKYD